MYRLKIEINNLYSNGCSDLDEVMESGKSFKKVKGVLKYFQQETAVRVKMGSGMYQFRYEQK